MHRSLKEELSPFVVANAEVGPAKAQLSTNILDRVGRGRFRTKHRILVIDDFTTGHMVVRSKCEPAHLYGRRSQRKPEAGQISVRASVDLLHGKRFRKRSAMSLAR
jgi:hypothetical protein